jgi:hypothetical protein
VSKSHSYVSKSHSACRNHSCACWNHSRECRNRICACGNYTLRMEIALYVYKTHSCLCHYACEHHTLCLNFTLCVWISRYACEHHTQTCVLKICCIIVVKNRRFWILISPLQPRGFIRGLFAIYLRFYSWFSWFIRSLLAVFFRFIRGFRILFEVNSRLLENFYDDIIIGIF